MQRGPGKAGSPIIAIDSSNRFLAHVCLEKHFNFLRMASVVHEIFHKTTTMMLIQGSKVKAVKQFETCLNNEKCLISTGYIFYATY